MIERLSSKDQISMRSLTLNEKISIKGSLDRYGVPAAYLVRLNTEEAIWFFGRCTGRSLADYALYNPALRRVSRSII